jgi:AbrB family looped-hinge helix DNA binding protein
MLESTITAKGQTTVPAEIRERTGAEAGARIVWTVTSNGTIIARLKTRSVLDLVGSLRPPKGTRVAIDDMNAWR